MLLNSRYQMSKFLINSEDFFAPGIIINILVLCKNFFFIFIQLLSREFTHNMYVYYHVVNHSIESNCLLVVGILALRPPFQ